MKKGLIQIMFANIISLVIGMLTNFILPKFLSFESYAAVKTYALYLTYAGFFSLGYNDGMYLKYGGKDINNIDEKGFSKNFINYFFIIFLMTIIVLIIGIIMNDSIVIAFAFGLFSYNILGYLKSFYQATGEFKLYGNCLNFEKILIFILNLFFVFIIKSDNSNFYIGIQVISGIVICIFLTLKLNRQINFLKYLEISFFEIKENIKSGFILMLGNFSSGLLTGIDRWFVKIFLTTIDFAKYSFATGMENIISVFTTPITIAMYNYFCKKKDVKDIKMFKNVALIWGTIVIALAYPAKFILNNFLKDYQSANNIIFILFATQIFNIIVKGIYVNIYKAQKMQRKYLTQMCLILLLAAILDFIFIKLFNSMLLIALATLITTIVWLLICEFGKNNQLRFSVKEYIYIFTLLIIYIVTGYLLDPVIGLIVYIATLIVSSLLLMKSTIYYLKKYVMEIIDMKFKFAK